MASDSEVLILTDPHPSHFILGYQLSQCDLKVNRTIIICKKQWLNPNAAKTDTHHYLVAFRNSVHKSYERTLWQTVAVMESHSYGIGSDLSMCGMVGDLRFTYMMDSPSSWCRPSHRGWYPYIWSTRWSSLLKSEPPPNIPDVHIMMQSFELPLPSYRTTWDMCWRDWKCLTVFHGYVCQNLFDADWKSFSIELPHLGFCISKYESCVLFVSLVFSCFRCQTSEPCFIRLFL